MVKNAHVIMGSEMRIGLLGTIGYSLSFIIILITLLGQLPNFLFALLAYPVSIAVRGVFWLRLGSQTKNKYFKTLSALLLILGFTISALILYEQLHYLDMHLLVPAAISHIDEDILKIIVSLWASYTAAEALGYVSYARFLGIWTAYLGALNLPSAIILVYQLLLLENPLVFLLQPLGYMLIIALFMLLCSAVGIIYGSFVTKIDIALKVPEKKEKDELDIFLRRELSLKEDSSADQASRTYHIRSQKSSSSDKDILPRQLTQSPLIIVEVISRSGEAFCTRCSTPVPVGTKDCPSCKSKLYESRPGIKCPVCGAPLSYSNRITSDHRVCGICFSDLRLRQVST